MALTLEGINLVKQRARAETRKPGVQATLKTLFTHLATHKGNPDLQFVALDYYGRADQVIANVPCRLYALYLKKPIASTTAAWVKVSDHATVSATAPDLAIPLAASPVGQEFCVIFPDGLALAIGATTAEHTAIDGSTDSATADACQGFAIIGAA